jgi:hypothetical protein
MDQIIKSLSQSLGLPEGAIRAGLGVRLNMVKQKTAASGNAQFGALIGLLASLAAVFSGAARLFGPAQTRAPARLSGLLMPVAGAAWLAALGFYACYFLRASADAWTVFIAWPDVMRLGAFAALAGAVATGLAAVSAALAWPKADWSVWRRTRIVATLLAMGALGLALNAWNLVGPRF